MRKSVFGAICLAIALTGVDAHGALTILKSGGEPATEQEASITYNGATGGWNITLASLHNPWGDTVYDIVGDGGETIDNLVIAVDGPPAGSPLLVRVLSDGPDGIRTLHNIVQTGDAETLLTDVHVREDVGSIQADVIGSVTSGRDVIGPVISTTEDNSIRGVYWVWAERDVLGDVIAEHGRIGGVFADRHIGRASDPVTIAAKHRVHSVVALGDVHADIDSRRNGGNGTMYVFVAQRFVGSMNIDAIVPDFATGTPGAIAIYEYFEGLITLGKSLDHAEEILILPTSQMRGQIVVNADNAEPGLWITPTFLGDENDPNRLQLDAPYYTHPAEAMGGGSIGLVPFALHEESCTPVSGGEAEGSSSRPLQEIRLRHYGPIELLGGAPVQVERRPYGSTGQFVAIPVSQLSFNVAEDDPNSLAVRLDGAADGFGTWFEYRVHVTDQLRSAAPGSPAVVWHDSYSFSVVAPACEGDINQDGDVSADDFIIVLAFWGPSAPVTAIADLTGDGWINTDDLLAVLANWGSCLGPAAPVTRSEPSRRIQPVSAGRPVARSSRASPADRSSRSAPRRRPR